MGRVARSFAVVVALLALVACSELEVVLGGRMCSRYNDQLDDFRMTIRDGDTALQIGAVFDLSIDRSWLDIDLRRESLTCEPEWVVEPAGVVEVKGTTVTALAPGTANLKAVVSGRGGTVTDYVNVAVLPLVTEREPNNGMPAANLLVSGRAIYGKSDYSGDEDWYYADLPAGSSLQFTLRRSIDADHGSFSYHADGEVYDSDGNSLGWANTTITNSTGATARYYLRVTSGGVVPYSVAVDFFGG